MLSSTFKCRDRFTFFNGEGWGVKQLFKTLITLKTLFKKNDCFLLTMEGGNLNTPLHFKKNSWEPLFYCICVQFNNSYTFIVRNLKVLNILVM